MTLPQNDREREKLKAYLRARQSDEGFGLFLSWIESELKKRDIENRIRGFENTETAAQALAKILEIVAACQMPETDRTKEESGIGSMSASVLM